MSAPIEATTRVVNRSKSTPIQKTMDVHIDQHFSSKVYTSGSTIAGHVAVRVARDTPFDNVEIFFTGIAATRLDFVQQYPSHSFRPFMKIRMPIADSEFPEDRVFLAEQEYKIPFHFVVPHQLTIGACNHKGVSPDVRERHLRLPPSLGNWEADDQAPEMTQVEYAIKARAVQDGQGTSSPVKLMEAHHILKVLPSLPEDAPLDITFLDERYKLTKTKTIRKSLFSTKTGQLTVSASQPGAVILSADGHKASMTRVRMNLDFLPSSSETTPPKINSVSGKLISTTFFGAAPAERLPDLGSRNNYAITPTLNYMTTSSLFSLPVDSVSWMQQNVSSLRRDSGYSSTLADENASDSDAAEGRRRRGSLGGNNKKSKGSPIKHTTDIEIPVSIPYSNKKFFVPTFHSCLISRTYTLQLSLSVGPTNTAISLAIPLQISVENIHEPQGSDLPSFESAIAEAEQEVADAYLQPRLMSIPDIGVQSNSLLPGYDEFRRRTISVS